MTDEHTNHAEQTQHAEDTEPTERPEDVRAALLDLVAWHDAMVERLTALRAGEEPGGGDRGTYTVIGALAQSLEQAEQAIASEWQWIARLRRRWK